MEVIEHPPLLSFETVVVPVIPLNYPHTDLLATVVVAGKLNSQVTFS